MGALQSHADLGSGKMFLKQFSRVKPNIIK